MNTPTPQRLRYFLFSQHLADGIRITMAIIFPVIILAQFGMMSTGLTIATGAFCTSICDIPGPVDSRRNGMLYGIGFIFLMSLLTGLLNQYDLLMGLLVTLAAFFFSMLSVYGNRASSVGTAALLIMILRMSDLLPLQATITDSLLIIAGAIWYLAVVLIFYRLTPYRPAQRALGDCIHETAKFLQIKSALYNSQSDFEEEYRKLVSQQIIVNEKQDATREILFKNKEILKDPSRTGRLLVLAFADTVDLYEQITATWYDYWQLRERFAATGLLDEVAVIIQKIAGEIDEIGLAIQSNSSFKKQYDLIADLDKLKAKIDALDDTQNSHLVLKKILVNLRKLGEHADELSNYFSLTISPKGRIRNKTDYSKFVSHNEIEAVVFKNNLHLASGIFRHSLRMTIACVTGFIIAKLMPYGHHSYWILLTIIIILKPGFSLTKERNMQRFAGTIAGGLIGVLILYFIHDRNVLFGIIIFFMISTYTFQRLNYIVMVIFITPYILILFHLLGLGFLKVAEERLLDTGIACVLSFLASYLLFPQWESVQLDNFLKQVLKANISYLDTLVRLFSGLPVSSLEYKLTRKEVYVNSANLSAAFNRMLSEPKSKQRHEKLIYEFVVLNHVLSSNIASLSADMFTNEQRIYPREIISHAKRSLTTLEESLLSLDKNYLPAERKNVQLQLFSKEITTEKQLTEQLDFIYKVTQDINKLTKLLAA